ncbi:MAG: DMT family transporter, partial [Bacteroidetes bacterium]|nr:DMT family transporter [Bacteroidota bacterium]
MPPDPRLKGYSLALLATLAGSTVYIFSKAALNQVSLAQFGVYWFAFAIFWNVLYALRLPKFRAFPLIRGHSLRMLMLIGIIELIATGAFYAAIRTSENPAIPSFLRNMEYIFVTLMGVMILKERFTIMELIGVILTFSGALVISYNRELTLTSFITGTSGFMLLSTSFYGVRTIMVKTHIRALTPSILAINRALFLFTTAFLILMIRGESLEIPTRVMVNIAIGSFFGPFLTSIGQYSALKYIEASRLAILQSTTAMFVLIGAYLIFGRFPLGYQLAGGAMTIAGPMWLL